jgi:CubicO group peptidase (beta-lactamase class C family)
MSAYMARSGAPLGSLAVVRDGRLVHESAYGLADSGGAPIVLSTRFRVASLSKMWTASAIRVLVARGALRYDTAAYPLLDIRPHGRIDRRLTRVTVQQLLDHTGGWDSALSGDPMFASRAIARTLDVPTPPSMWQMAYYMFSRPLDFEPGTRSAYSNFGYGVLGLLITAVTGLSYEEAVKRLVLRPLGISAMSLGRSLTRNWDEPDYTMPPGSAKVWSAFDPPSWVDFPYGGFALEPMAAHGGWIATARDLARYAAALDERAGHAVPRPESRPVPTMPGHRYWYFQTGSLPGTYSIIRRDWDGAHFTAACALFNRRTGNWAIDSSILETLGSAAMQVATWPPGEPLFGALA